MTDDAGIVVGGGPLVMPHRTDWTNWGDSNFVPVRLDADRTYTITIRDGWNMSYLAHYTNYMADVAVEKHPATMSTSPS